MNESRVQKIVSALIIALSMAGPTLVSKVNSVVSNRFDTEEVPVIVKVVIPESPNQPQATLVSQDKTISMQIPVVLAERRLNGERSGFFKAEIISGTLELGDRVESEAW